MNQLPGILAGILEGINGGADIVGEEEMFNDICKLVDPSR
jgi:hypothetical protein